MKSEKKVNAIKNWLAYLDYVKEEYPFGPFQEYRNEEGRLHRDNAPAYITPTRCIHYSNGRRHGLDVDIFGNKVYYYENIIIPRAYIEKPKDLKVEDIIANPNAEVRYVGLKLYGFERLLEEKYMQVVNEDPETEYKLLRFKFKDTNDDPYTVVRVVNSTAEPDGTFKIYYLTVPPDMKTAKQAVAWTFRMNEKDYAPSQET
jgi:hypothetical protein